MKNNPTPTSRPIPKRHYLKPIHGGTMMVCNGCNESTLSTTEGMSALTRAKEFTAFMKGHGDCFKTDRV